MALEFFKNFAAVCFSDKNLTGEVDESASILVLYNYITLFVSFFPAGILSVEHTAAEF